MQTLRRIFLFLLLAVVVASCSSTPKQYSVSKELKSKAETAKNQAKLKIIKRGTPLPKDYGFLLKPVKSEKIVYGRPTFFDGNVYACANAAMSGNIITVKFAYLNSPDEVELQILEHEFAHGWLLINHNEPAHLSKYSKDFFNWK